MKKTRAQKREEEKAIIAQMEEGLRENAVAEEVERDFMDAEKSETPKTEKRGLFGKPQDPTPEKIHCKRCKTLMQNGVCPTCGYKTYVPMDEKKRKAVRLALTVVCIGVFLILFIATRA